MSMRSQSIFPQGSQLNPLYPTRPMREVMKILRTLCKPRYHTGGDPLEFELELHRLAVVLPTIPPDRALLHWVNRWGVSLKRDGEPLPPVSVASYLLEHCQYPQSCSRSMDFSFLPWEQESLSSLHPFSENRNALEWTTLRLQQWGRKIFLPRSKGQLFDGLIKYNEEGESIKEIHLALFENVCITLASYLYQKDKALDIALGFFDPLDHHWLPEFCNGIDSHASQVAFFKTAFETRFEAPHETFHDRPEPYSVEEPLGIMINAA